MPFEAQPKGRLLNALRIGLSTDEELLRWDEESPLPELDYDEWEARRCEKRDAALRVLASKTQALL